MENFDEYVAEQARKKHEREEAVRVEQDRAEVERLAARDTANKVFNQDVMPTLTSAARSLSTKVKSEAKSDFNGLFNVGILEIGHANARNRVVFKVTQRMSDYKFETLGPHVTAKSESVVKWDELPSALSPAIKDAIDRWFGTNAGDI